MLYKELMYNLKYNELPVPEGFFDVVPRNTLRRWKSKESKPSPGKVLVIKKFFPEVFFELDDIQFFKAKDNFDLTRCIVKEQRDFYKKFYLEQKEYGAKKIPCPHTNSILLYPILEKAFLDSWKINNATKIIQRVKEKRAIQVKQYGIDLVTYNGNDCMQQLADNTIEKMVLLTQAYGEKHITLALYQKFMLELVTMFNVFNKDITT